MNNGLNEAIKASNALIHGSHGAESSMNSLPCKTSPSLGIRARRPSAILRWTPCCG